MRSVAATGVVGVSGGCCAGDCAAEGPRTVAAEWAQGPVRAWGNALKWMEWSGEWVKTKKGCSRCKHWLRLRIGERKGTVTKEAPVSA